VIINYLKKLICYKRYNDLLLFIDGENNNTNNISENAADIISPNLQESMRSNNQIAAIINHQKHKKVPRFLTWKTPQIKGKNHESSRPKK